MNILNLFEFFSLFDFITPTIGVIQDFSHDPYQTNTWRCIIDYEQCLENGYNANDIENLLKSHNIECWGTQISRDMVGFPLRRTLPLELMISIHSKDIAMANFVFGRYGIKTLM